jgi:hypothetical protein
MQVTQGIWIVLAGAFASSSTGTPASAIAISGGLGVVLAAALAMSWRSRSANRTNLFLSSRRLVRSIRCALLPPWGVPGHVGWPGQVHSLRIAASLGVRGHRLGGGVRSIRCALLPPWG